MCVLDANKESGGNEIFSRAKLSMQQKEPRRSNRILSPQSLRVPRAANTLAGPAGLRVRANPFCDSHLPPRHHQTAFACVGETRLVVVSSRYLCVYSCVPVEFMRFAQLHECLARHTTVKGLLLSREELGPTWAQVERGFFLIHLFDTLFS